jgi:catechol 2,3-dioxygenase-like lactoylglutathione lyase family enzyme
MSRPNDVLGVHSIGEFVVAVPDLAKADHFYKSFGLNITERRNSLELRTKTAGHRWATVIEGPTKRLHHVSFNCFEDDLTRFASHLESEKIRRIDPPELFGDDGLWFRGHDNLCLSIRVGPKTSPSDFSRISPSSHEPAIANAPYRRFADKVEIVRLSHILLFTTDMDDAIDFYTRLLGLRLSDRSADVVGFLHGYMAVITTCWHLRSQNIPDSIMQAGLCRR